MRQGEPVSVSVIWGRKRQREAGRARERQAELHRGVWWFKEVRDADNSVS